MPRKYKREDNQASDDNPAHTKTKVFHIKFRHLEWAKVSKSKKFGLSRRELDSGLGRPYNHPNFVNFTFSAIAPLI